MANDTPQQLAKSAESQTHKEMTGAVNRAKMSPAERESWEHVGDGYQPNAPGTRGGAYGVARAARKEQ